jgi:hypothetical protein
MSTWIPISERMPTREDADERGEVAWKWADGTTCTGRFEDGGEEQDPAVAWHPLPPYTPSKSRPTDTECANILHYSALASALACANHLDPKDDVPREEQFAMVRRWFADVTARIEREKRK